MFYKHKTTIVERAEMIMELLCIISCGRKQNFALNTYQRVAGATDEFKPLI